MIVTQRPRESRGHLNHGWLDTYHTFSFGEYFDPDWKRFRSLRVMNEDVVAPGQGFGMHGHRDMEILTWVLSGELEHRDSLGHGEILKPGEMQWMSAGTGIRHSEFNPSTELPVHLYQIWLLPDRQGQAPAYAQRTFSSEGRHNTFQLLASPDGNANSLAIRQDASVSVADVDQDVELSVPIAPHRFGWLQVLRGNVELSGVNVPLVAGDGVYWEGWDALALHATESSQVMLFDLA